MLNPTTAPATMQPPASSLPPPPPQARRNADFLSRATGGITQRSLHHLESVGRTEWMRWQLAPDGTDTEVLNRTIGSLESQTLPDAEYFAQYRLRSVLAANQLTQATIARAIHSRWQLRERMVDFWHDHFSVSHPENRTSRLTFRTYDRDAIRAHVFGRFEDMLLATAKSAAMLNYLNGNDNVAGAPNENYSREVMELHTLGVNGPYTETDVAELARCLTGWDYYGVAAGALAGTFLFRPNRHDSGPKTVLGLPIPSGGGVEDGEMVLSLLAGHADTADFVSRKLVRRFVSESASEAAIALVRDAWLTTGGDLTTVTAVLFSDAVADLAEPWNHRKVKRPFQLVTSLFRVIEGGSTTAYRQMPSLLENLGQRPFYWPAPNGYPDSSGAWAGDLYGRWDFGSRYIDNRLPGHPVDDAMVATLRGDVREDALAEHLNQVMTGGGMEASEVFAVQRWIDSYTPMSVRETRDAIGLAINSPSYQLH